MSVTTTCAKTSQNNSNNDQVYHRYDQYGANAATTTPWPPNIWWPLAIQSSPGGVPKNLETPPVHHVWTGRVYNTGEGIYPPLNKIMDWSGGYQNVYTVPTDAITGTGQNSWEREWDYKKDMWDSLLNVETCLHTLFEQCVNKSGHSSTSGGIGHRGFGNNNPRDNLKQLMSIYGKPTENLQIGNWR